MPPANRRATSTLIVGACLALVGSCGSSIPQTARPTAGTNVIAFGDSLVEGRGAPAGRDFSAVLAERLGVPIIKAGRSGDTTGMALRRLHSEVLSADPRVVIVLLGGNDFLRRVPIDETFGNLDTMVAQIRERGAAVVLVGVSVGLFDAYAARYEALAQQHAAVFVPDILDGIMGRSALTSDAIHPNERGYSLIADRLEPVVRELLTGN